MPQEKKSEIDAARDAVWDLVSKGLKKHTLNYVHSSGGHGIPPYDSPDSFTSCKSLFDDSQPCTCGADKYNKSLRDIADRIIAVMYGETKGN